MKWAPVPVPINPTCRYGLRRCPNLPTGFSLVNLVPPGPGGNGSGDPESQREPLARSSRTSAEAVVVAFELAQQVLRCIRGRDTGFDPRRHGRKLGQIFPQNVVHGNFRTARIFYLF